MVHLYLDGIHSYICNSGGWCVKYDDTSIISSFKMAHEKNWIIFLEEKGCLLLWNRYKPFTFSDSTSKAYIVWFYEEIYVVSVITFSIALLKDGVGYDSTTHTLTYAHTYIYVYSKYISS